MTSIPTSAPAHDIVIFGGAGDLSWRKLLPALYMADLHGRLEPSCRILGVGRHAWSRAQYQAFVDEKARACVEAGALQPEAWAQFLQRLDFVSLDASQPEGYGRLKSACREEAVRIFYLATAPNLFTAIAGHLDAAGLVDAAARELRATGYVHNRARMIAASFLSAAWFRRQVKHVCASWLSGVRSASCPTPAARTIVQ